MTSRSALLVLCAAASAWSQAAPAAKQASPARSEWNPPAVRRPSALIASPGDGKAYLEWNPNLEEGLAGYRLYRQDGAKGHYRVVNAKPVTGSEFVDTGLKNGDAVRYRVAAVLRSGLESAQSNVAEVTPRAVKAPEVTNGQAEIRVPGYDAITVANAISVTFENGHKLVFDRTIAKVRDWVTSEGLHLLYPIPYGNPIDITEMDDMGFPVAQPANADQPAVPPQINLNYGGAQARRGAGGVNSGMVWWVGYQVADNRITFQYRIPLNGPGIPAGSTSDLTITATLWETWTPVERKINGGATYKGLSRKIELDMPSYLPGRPALGRRRESVGLGQGLVRVRYPDYKEIS